MPSLYGQGLYGKGDYSLKPTVDFAGDLAPSAWFSGVLDVLVAKGNLAGDLRPQIALGASLTVDRVFQGNLSPGIVLAATLTSGPLWAASAPGAPPWSSSEPCPPSLWTPDDPCAPVDWEETELCDG